MTELAGEQDIAALRRQDAAAFTRLVREHEALVLGLCQSMGLRNADADDAAAEAFAAVYRALPNFESRSALTTWVYRIAARSILKVRRRRDANKTSGDVPEFAAEATPDAAEAAETSEKVWLAVAALDPRQAMAVELFYRREWSVERIAEAMECPAGTVKTLLFRAREKLRDVFTRQEIGI